VTGARHPADGATVLHVVESLGGGVLSAMRDYLRSTPTLRHVVLARSRAGDDTGESFEGLAARVFPAPESLDLAIRAVNQVHRRIQPDIVHAHSSYAGAWVRLSRVPRRRVVYTPHCFAFERRDLGRPLRAMLHGVEAALSHRTAHVAGVAPREVALARRLRRGQRATYVPNIARIEEDARQRPPRHSRTPVLVGAGRLCPQKDPDYFHRVARRILEQRPDTRLRWIGGGDERHERALRAAGVDVTGWIDRPLAMRALADADVYIHTAAWEGAPISILEAAAIGVPIAARRIPALESLGLPALQDDPSDLADLALSMTTDPVRQVALDAAAAVSERHRPEHQHDALMDVYGTVVGADAAHDEVPAHGVDRDPA
jgi:glycosyltransferase involved in cell wall biosynthesis